MTMREELEQAKASFIARLPEEAQHAVFGHIKDQLDSGQAFGLRVGEQAPNFTLTGPHGEPITLNEELATGPVALTFYRGSWCPYCNIELRAYEQRISEIRNLGAQLIAISPQNPDHTLTQKEKEQLSYHVLSDSNGQVAARYRLLFELPSNLQHTFLTVMKRDLTIFNATDRWILPVPATYIIDREGIVRYAASNPDFMQRTDPQIVIDELKKLL
ncbi:peroxiredoxin [Paenibacillus cellulosilyticus]|uniref:thioredoxin-dependent peroxiredoxin n=1 Tax=Paenibacillus cellulosilyticus TaxID=375489 RepID=A0A2V2YRZ3_9BACL|nr:peroxiredoxin-like family protein [Paenibacillus cellulosilyticus]PWW00774.1 peroxiredoxin [Paenibacillus cellulosilyticus]QKS45629.1 AhpC/TSA family protein [Paenibacillus cellulosilyticus]